MPIDNSGWDGSKALSQCETAADFRKICAGEKNVGEPDQRQHWALPHHYLGKHPAPNASGVRNALARLPQTQGLTNREAAERHLRRHMTEIQEASMATTEAEVRERPPRDNLFRAMRPGYELRKSDGGMPTLTGHFTKYNEWTEIDSIFEGHFLERIAPGAFDKTFAENRDRMRVLFNHGQDPMIGDKVIGPIKELRSDDVGPFYEVPMLDTAYNRELIPGLEANQYGSSFRFRVTKERFEKNPDPSDHNPEGLPERTITEAHVMEFGPVTFPAYEGADAGVRSMTDRFYAKKLTRGEGLETLVETVREETEPEKSTPNDEITAEPDATTRQQAWSKNSTTNKEQKKMTDMNTQGVNIDQFRDVADLEARQEEIASRMGSLDAEFTGRELSTEAQAEWDQLVEEREAITRRVAHLLKRQRDLLASDEGKRDGPQGNKWENRGPTSIVRVPPEYNLNKIREQARTPDEEERLVRDNAKRALEVASFPQVKDDADAKTHISRLLNTQDEKAGISRRILATGSERYQRAFAKRLANQPVSREEEEALAVPDQVERALNLTGAQGGFAVPFTLDPTIIPTSNGVVNPIRQLARVIQIAGDEFRGISSAGITASYAAEAAEVGDNAPTLAQPVISAEKAHAFVPFSIEIGMDWGGLQAEMARLLQESKDELEAAKFINGTGTNEPFGVLTGTTNTVNAAAGADTFSLANVYALLEALPPRYQPNANFIANLAIMNRIRQLDPTNTAVWVNSLQPGNPAQLLGVPISQASAMPATAVTGNKFLLIGDFSRYVIVDRVGLNVETVQHLFGVNRRPTGERGLYAYWRNGAKVVDANGFRALVGTA